MISRSGDGAALRLPLRWIAILYTRVAADFAATGAQLRGSMSQVHVAEPAAFERAHYVRTVGAFFSLSNPLALQGASVRVPLD